MRPSNTSPESAIRVAFSAASALLTLIMKLQQGGVTVEFPNPVRDEKSGQYTIRLAATED